MDLEVEERVGDLKARFDQEAKVLRDSLEEAKRDVVKANADLRQVILLLVVDTVTLKYE